MNIAFSVYDYVFKCSMIRHYGIQILGSSVSLKPTFQFFQFMNDHQPKFSFAYICVCVCMYVSERERERILMSNQRAEQSDSNEVMS